MEVVNAFKEWHHRVFNSSNTFVYRLVTVLYNNHSLWVTTWLQRVIFLNCSHIGGGGGINSTNQWGTRYHFILIYFSSEAIFLLLILRIDILYLCLHTYTLVLHMLVAYTQCYKFKVVGNRKLFQTCLPGPYLDYY